MRRAPELLVGSMLVYGLMAACSGGAKMAATGAPQAHGGEKADGVGGERNASSGAPGVTDGGRGGLLDPVPDAGAQEAGSGPGPTSVTYTRHDVDCDAEITIAGTDYPAAVFTFEQPDIIKAARTLAIGPAGSTPGWWQSGHVYVREDGSEAAVTCAGSVTSVAFLVPD